MRKIALLIIGTSLVGMAPPALETDLGALSGEQAGGYPPCSRTVTDRCIQLYERGVNTPANLALNRSRGARASAMGGPYEPSVWRAPPARGSWAPRSRESGYPACSRTVTDRCIQLYERGVTGTGN